MGYMVAKRGRKNAEVKFVVRPGRPVKQVRLAGTFTEWETGALLMRKSRDGEWTRLVKLTPGAHEYKYIVDGEWWTDPEIPDQSWNAFGTPNSLARLE